MNELTKNENLSFGRTYTEQDLERMVDQTLQLFDNGDLQQSNEIAVYNVHNLLQNIAEYAKGMGNKLSEREKQLMQQSAGMMAQVADKTKSVQDPQTYLQSVAELIDESVVGTNHAKNSLNLEQGKFGEYQFQTDVQKQIGEMKEEQGYLE